MQGLRRALLPNPLTAEDYHRLGGMIQMPASVFQGMVFLGPGFRVYVCLFGLEKRRFSRFEAHCIVS